MNPLGPAANSSSKRVSRIPRRRCSRSEPKGQSVQQYDANFARASAEFVEPLLDAAGVAAGTKVLDLCCGTGLVAAAAARRAASPTGVDF